MKWVFVANLGDVVAGKIKNSILFLALLMTTFFAASCTDEISGDGAASSSSEAPKITESKVVAEAGDDSRNEYAGFDQESIKAIEELSERKPELCKLEENEIGRSSKFDDFSIDGFYEDVAEERVRFVQCLRDNGEETAAEAYITIYSQAGLPE